MLQKKALISALITGAAILGFSAVASADLPGFYAGGELGWSNLHFSDNPFNTQSGTGLGGGGQVGYQFNPYIAAELGYLYFHDVHQNVGSYGAYGIWNGTYKEQAGDLLVKGTLPLNPYFSIYGKAGAAYVDSQAEISSSTLYFAPNGNVYNGSYNYSETTHPIRPVYGIGVSYNITPNVSADLGWTRIQRTSNNLPNADIAALGLTYHFG